MFMSSRSLGFLISCLTLFVSAVFTSSASADRFCYRLYDQNGAYEIYKTPPIPLQTPPGYPLRLADKRLVITVEDSCLRTVDANRVYLPEDTFTSKTHPLLQTMQANPGLEPKQAKAAQLSYQQPSASSNDPNNDPIIPYYGDRSKRQSFTTPQRY